MKKQLLMLLGVLFALPAHVVAFDYTYEGKTITYTVISEADKTVKTIDDSSLSNSGYVFGDLILPEKVQYKGTQYTLIEIGERSFIGWYRLTSVTIPNSVITIGDQAFNGCSGLTSVTIPNSVTSIGNDAFNGCSGLTSVEIPNSVTDIGSQAFLSCYKLTSVTIPTSVTSIGRSAFDYCLNLHNVYFNAKNCTIDCNMNNSVYDTFPTTISNFVFGDEVTRIPEGVLSGNEKIQSINIPASVTEIGNWAFGWTTVLKEIVIPNSVKTIGKQAFYKSESLESVQLGTSVTEIGSDAFNGCTRLIKADISDLAAWWAINFGNETANPLYYAKHLILNDEEVTDLVFPETVTSIGQYAFYNCTGLTSVTIPNSVASMGQYAFYNCTGLTTVSLKSFTPPNYYYMFDSNKNTATLIIPDGTYADYLNSDWQNFLSIKDEANNELNNYNDQVFTYRYMPDSGEAVLVNSANYSSMTSASIPDRIYVDEGDAQGFYKVTGIAANTFENCTKLTQLKISANCTFIGENAFNGCTGLKSVEIPDAVTTIYDYAFNGCTGLTTVEIPNSVTSIGNSAFSGCTRLTNVKIPKSIKTIGNSAFYGCTGLQRVEISDLTAWCNIKFADDYSNPVSYAKKLFMIQEDGNTTEIVNLVIPNDVTSIGAYTFYNADALTSVKIPASLISVGEEAFNGCTSFSKVEIVDLGVWCNIDFANSSSNPLSYANKLYLNEEEITELVIPNTVDAIGAYTFYNATDLTSVIIPDAVKSIGDDAFSGCSKVESLTFEDGIDELSIGANSFSGIQPTSVYLGRGYNVNIPVPTNLTIGGFMTKLPENAYKGNKTLKTLTIEPGMLQNIGASAFQGCSNLKEVTFPENYVEIGENAFASTGLRELTLPSGEIADNAFDGNSLTEVVLGSKVAVIGQNAFNGSNALANVYSTPSTPPAAQNNSFSYYEGQLWVPEDAIDTYYDTAPCWYRFSAKALVIPEDMKVYGETKLQGYTGDTIQLTAELSPADVTLDRILWRSTNPAVATVDNNGLVTLHNFDLSDASDEALMALADTETRTVQIIASTLYENGPQAVVTIDVETLGIEYINSDSQLGNGSNDRPNDIYNLQGVLLKRNASQEDVDALAPGLYIISGKKVLVK